MSDGSQAGSKPGGAVPPGTAAESVETVETDTESETYWILRRDQVECLASSRRQDLLDRLAAAGDQSVKQCATAVGMKPSAAYRHVSALLEAGLIEVAGTRVVNRKQETLYRAVAPRMRLARALDRPDLHPSLSRVVYALSRQMARDFERGLGHGDGQCTGSDRNLGFYRHVGAPSVEVMREINGHLDRIAELLWRQPEPDRPLISFGWVMAPVGDEGRDEGRA